MKKSVKDGFALAEVVVALFFVTFVIIVVAGLGEQVMQLMRRSTQTGAILELRNMSNAISRNPGSWLTQMRASPQLSGLYAGCIPDPKLNVSTYSCPSSMDSASLNAFDPQIASLAGGTYHTLSSYIVNNTGELIAGPIDAPVYLSSDGRPCASANTSICSFKSVGFFMRTNSDTNEDPGSVKFVIKISKNTVEGSAMKPQYITMDIGDSWKDFDASLCPSGTIKMGYLSIGTPYCVNPTDPCDDANQVIIGVDGTGNSICKNLPTCTGQLIGLNSTGNDLECISTSPCGPNKIFLGFFGGSGDPICQGSSNHCGSGQIQVGTNVDLANGVTPECVAAPETLSCPLANEKIAFNGVGFDCQAVGTSISCGEGRVLAGISANGQPTCVDDQTGSGGISNVQCTGGSAEYVYGFGPSGNLLCNPTPSGTNGTNGTNGNNGSNASVAAGTCAPHQEMYGVSSTGSVLCRDSGEKRDPIYNIKKNIDTKYGTKLTLMPSFISCRANSSLVLNYTFDQFRLSGAGTTLKRQAVYIYHPENGFFVIYDADTGQRVSGNANCPSSLPIDGSVVSVGAPNL